MGIPLPDQPHGFFGCDDRCDLCGRSREDELHLVVQMSAKPTVTMTSVGAGLFLVGFLGLSQWAWFFLTYDFVRWHLNVDPLTLCVVLDGAIVFAGAVLVVLARWGDR